jgi:hypothetical protein
MQAGEKINRQGGNYDHTNVKQTQIRMILVSLLLGLILALWPKPSFLQNIASQEQAGSNVQTK